MSNREPISFMFPCHKLADLGAYYGLAQTKNSKLDTAIAGSNSWSKFLDTRMIAGTRVYLSINDAPNVQTGFDLLNCDWSHFVQAMDPRIWELLSHLKPNSSTPPESMRMRHVDIVAQIALIASLPFAKLSAVYAERHMWYLEYPKLDLLDDKGQAVLESTNECFEALFSAHDETPAYIQAVNFKGLFNGAA